MGLYHVCLFCVSYVCNLVLFIMIGRVWGEQKQTKKKTVKRNRDSCCAFTLAYKRKGGEGQKRLLYKAKLCYRDQIRPFKLPAILFVQLDRRSGGGGKTSLRS